MTGLVKLLVKRITLRILNILSAGTRPLTLSQQYNQPKQFSAASRTRTVTLNALRSIEYLFDFSFVSPSLLAVFQLSLNSTLPPSLFLPPSALGFVSVMCSAVLCKFLWPFRQLLLVNGAHCLLVCRSECLSASLPACLLACTGSIVIQALWPTVSHS